MNLEKIKELLAYDSTTGIFTWKVKPRSARLGDLPGSVTQGKLVISVAGVAYRADALAWLFYYGEPHKGRIKHLDGNNLNDSINNLEDRLAFNGKIISHRNMPDMQNTNGLWLASHSPEPFVANITRAGCLWGDMTKRTTPDSYFQNAHQSYVGTRNEFLDFQDFASWCQDEYGYWSKSINGQFWQLDKDLLIPEHPHYSRESCMFIPKIVNVSFTSVAERGLPPGVYEAYKNRRWSAIYQSATQGRRRLGYFKDPFEAHRVWQENKLLDIAEMIKDPQLVDHKKLQIALQIKYEQVLSDIRNQEVTRF